MSCPCRSIPARHFFPADAFARRIGCWLFVVGSQDLLTRSVKPSFQTDSRRHVPRIGCWCTSRRPTQHWPPPGLATTIGAAETDSIVGLRPGCTLLHQQGRHRQHAASTVFIQSRPSSTLTSRPRPGLGWEGGKQRSAAQQQFASNQQTGHSSDQLVSIPAGQLGYCSARLRQRLEIRYDCQSQEE